MDQTKATIQTQVPGYYGSDGNVADAEKAEVTEAVSYTHLDVYKRQL